MATDQTTRLEAATVKAENGSQILYDVANLPADQTVTTASGPVKTVAGMMAEIEDKLAFATNIYETVADGLDATVNGEVFLAYDQNDEGVIYRVYRNANGSAVDTGKYAASAGDLQQAITDAQAAAAQAAQSAQALAGISEANGDNLVGHGNSTLRKRLDQRAYLSDYATKDEIDSGVYTQATIQSALNSGRKVIYTGPGSATINSTLSWPAGVMLLADHVRQFTLTFNTGTADGVSVVDPTSGAKYVTGFGNLHIKKGDIGGNLFTSPRSSNAWSRQLYYVFKGNLFTDVNEGLTITTNYWEKIINLGDTKGVIYDDNHAWGPQASTATNDALNATGFYAGSNTGAIQISITNSTFTSMTRGVNFGDGVEGYYVAHCEFVSDWIGIDHSNAGLEPGGFIHDVHTNCSYRGIRLQQRAEFNINNISCYRASGLVDHGLGYAGVEINNCNFKGNISNVNMVPGSSTAVAGSSVIKIYNCKATKIKINMVNMSLQLERCFDIDSATGIRITNPSVAGANIFASIKNSLFASGDIKFTGVDATNSDSTLVVIESGSSPTTISCERLPRGSTNQPQIVTLAADQDYTIQPKAGYTTLAVGAATNPNVVLSTVGATAGDTLRFKFVNSNTAGKTTRIYGGASSTTALNVIASGNTNRYLIEYQYSGTAWACTAFYQDLDTSFRA